MKTIYWKARRCAGIFPPTSAAKGIEHAGCLAAKLLFLHQDIDGENDSENKVKNRAENRSGNTNRGVDQLAGIALEVIHHGSADFFPVNFQIGEGRGVHLEEGGGLGDPLFHLPEYCGMFSTNRLKARLSSGTIIKIRMNTRPMMIPKVSIMLTMRRNRLHRRKFLRLSGANQPLLDHLEQNIEDKSGAKSDDERHQQA